MGNIDQSGLLCVKVALCKMATGSKLPAEFFPLCDAGTVLSGFD
jgi:hypothetical protein